jgi:hypothetical protein
MFILIALLMMNSNKKDKKEGVRNRSHVTDSFVGGQCSSCGCN